MLYNIGSVLLSKRGLFRKPVEQGEKKLLRMSTLRRKSTQPKHFFPVAMAFSVHDFAHIMLLCLQNMNFK